MRRLFFDVATRRSIQYDFRGRDFQKIEDARQLAELIAIDLECTDGEDLLAKEVQVRDIAGRQLFAIPICLAV